MGMFIFREIDASTNLADLSNEGVSRSAHRQVSTFPIKDKCKERGESTCGQAFLLAGEESED